MNPTLRLPLIVAVALAASACSDLDCMGVQRYHGATLSPRITAAEGLTAPTVSDVHTVPGGAAPEGYRAGACLVRPPQIVEPPTAEMLERAKEKKKQAADAPKVEGEPRE